MKRILILIIGLIGLAYGQSSPTSAKTRFVNGIYLGTKLDSYFAAADSNAIYWSADSALMAKYKGAARRLAFAGGTDFVPYTGAVDNVSLGNFRLTARSVKTDSIYANGSGGMYLLTNSGNPVAHWGAGGSVEVDFKGFAGYDANRASSYTARSFTDKNYVDSADALRVRYTDTAAMLSPYLRRTDSTGLLSQVVRTFGTQTIGGNKTFSNDLVVNGRTTSNNFRATDSIVIGGAMSDLLYAIKTKSASAYGAVIENTEATPTNNPILLLRSNNGSTLSTVHTFTNSGRLGVNISIPLANLHVNGTALVTSTVSADGIVSTRSAAPQTPAFFPQMNTSALNDSSVVMLGRSGIEGGTPYNLFDFTMQQTVANQSTGSLSVNIFDNGGKKRVQEWTRDIVTIHRPLSGTSISMSGGATIGSLGDLIVNTTSTAATVTVGRVSGTSNDNTNFIVQNRVGTEGFKVLGADGTTLIAGATTDGTNKLIVNGGVKAEGGALLSTASFSLTGNDGGIDVINSGTLASGRTSQLRLTNGTTYFGANDRSYQLVNIGTSGTAADFYIQYFDGSSYFDRFRIASTGAATFSSSVTATGGGFNSDLSLKNVIGLGTLLNIADDTHVIRFTWKDPAKGTAMRYGYGAQYIQELIPEAVYKANDDTLVVDYTQVHTVLIDENTRRIKALEAEVAELKRQLNQR